MIVRPLALQSLSLMREGTVGGWTYKGEFSYLEKNYVFVLTVVTKDKKGSSDVASWFFSTDQFNEFTTLDCK